MYDIVSNHTTVINEYPRSLTMIFIKMMPHLVELCNL